MQISTEGSAKIRKDGSILLTKNLHESGRVIIKEKVNITKNPWKLNAIISMSDNKGISDSDGPGGDGIWFEFNERTFSIGFDTFLNEYNESGNEIDIFVEGQIVAKQHCPIKLNSGKMLKVDIVCIPTPKTIINISINNQPILSHILKTITLSEFLPNNSEFSLFAFTGAAGSKQIVHEVELKLNHF